MPDSLSTFDALAELLITQTQPTTSLDIGCGRGKYADLIERLAPSCARTGVEIDAGYIEEFSLRERYHELINADCMKLLDTPDRNWDLAIIGDTIEHLRKSHGIDLIHFLLYRVKVIYIVFPVHFLQNSWEGHIHEAHISHWSEHDFAGLDHLFVSLGNMRAVVIEGFIPHHSAVQQLRSAMSPETHAAP